MRQPRIKQMIQLVQIASIAWLAGIAAFIGGVFARIEGSAESEGKRKFIHGVVAFGGGILVAAVAFALVPHGMKTLSPVVLAVTFCAGGAICCLFNIRIEKSGGRMAQFMAMLLDFIPEAMALGAVFGQSRSAGMLLALFIGAQNLPEGFNAFRETVAGGVKQRAALSALFLVSFLGPAAACFGHLFLHSYPTVTACIMSAAAGGILYLVFEDIAPQAAMKRHWGPSLGAVLGFAVGMIGKQILG